MHVQMGALIRKHKQDEQRTLMGTRHTRVRTTKTGGTITNPTINNK